MTPQQKKAKELVNLFKPNSICHSNFYSKKNALNCVDEIIKALEDNHDYEKCGVEFTWWKEVKKEITKYYEH